jgi:membrane associated rhomboid family serine protease
MMLRNAKNLPNYLQKSRQNMVNNFMPKRGFNSRIDSLLENLISKIPNGNIGYLIVGLNSFFYFLYLIWPRYQMYSYLNNFTFSKYNLSNGYLHTFFTSHFAHMSFFTYAIDTAILYLFCNNLT